MPGKGERGVSMTEETKATQAQQQADPQAVDETTDWKAKYEEMRKHSRDWENKAKANQGAADELEKLKAAQMTEQEKAIARAEAAEKKLADLEAEKELSEKAAEIAKKYNVPADLLGYCKDEAAMTAFAEKYAENNHVSALPNARTNTRIVHSGGEPKKTNGDLFAEVAAELFNK